MIDLRKQQISTLKPLRQQQKQGLYWIICGALVGGAAGIVCVLYRYLLTYAEKYLFKIIDYIKGNPLKIALWFLALAVLSQIVTAIIKLEPKSAGSGIPQVSAEVHGYISPSWWKVLISKIIGSTLSVFGGLSLGREGPSVQLGGMAGKGVARIMKTSKTNEKRMISCGAGAGMAAAFNAPLTGIMFVLEEIHHTFNKSVLCMGIVATMTADFVSKMFFGQETIFHYDTVNIPLQYFWLVMIFGILLGVFGAFYNFSLLKATALFKKWKVPTNIKILIPFLLSGGICLVLPQILGGGHNMVSVLINEHPSIGVMLLLLIAKFLFSTICSGSSAPGGTLYPFLILASYIGAIYGDICINMFHLNANLWEEFIVIALAGFFSSIVRAPIIGIVLAFELTGNMNNLLALVVVSVISYAVADLLNVKPLYAGMLEQSVSKEPHIRMSKTAEKMLKTYVVPVGSVISGSKIKDIDWGKHCLVASILREEQSITPKGDVEIKDGDELMVLISQRRYSRDNTRLEELINKTYY